MTFAYYIKQHPGPSEAAAVLRVRGTEGWYLDRSTGEWVAAPWVRTEVDWGNETFLVSPEQAAVAAKKWGHALA